MRDTVVQYWSGCVISLLTRIIFHQYQILTNTSSRVQCVSNFTDHLHAQVHRCFYLFSFIQVNFKSQLNCLQESDTFISFLLTEMLFVICLMSK